MYTLDTNDPQRAAARRAGRRRNTLPYPTVPGFVGLSVLAVVIDDIYALFGHGVRSAFMSCMFLVPLLGGAVVYYLIGFLAFDAARAPLWRLASNLYNSGLAALAAGCMLQGILEIAGTASPYVPLFFWAGGGMAFIGLMLFGKAVWQIVPKKYKK